MIKYQYLPTIKQVTKALWNYQISKKFIIIRLVILPLALFFYFNAQNYSMMTVFSMTGGFCFFYILLIWFRYSLYFKKVAKAVLKDLTDEDSIIFDLESQEIETKTKLTSGKVKFEVFDGYRVRKEKIFLIKKNVNFLFLFKEGFECEDDFKKLVDCLRTSGMKEM